MALRASTERTGDRGDGGWFEGVLREGRTITWRCGHLHKTRDCSYPARPSARDCAADELRRRVIAETLGEQPDRDGGLSWAIGGPHGGAWFILWEPRRAGGNVRAFVGGSLEPCHRGHAADADAARAEARRIAALIAAGKAA